MVVDFDFRHRRFYFFGQLYVEVFFVPFGSDEPQPFGHCPDGRTLYEQGDESDEKHDVENETGIFDAGYHGICRENNRYGSAQTDP